METDKAKCYICYYCEEVVEWVNPEREWVHCENGEQMCGTLATPSNIEIDVEEMDSADI